MAYQLHPSTDRTPTDNRFVFNEAEQIGTNQAWRRGHVISPLVRRERPGSGSLRELRVNRSDLKRVVILILVCLKCRIGWSSLLLYCLIFQM